MEPENISVAILILILASARGQEGNPTVSTNSGTVVGRWGQTWGGERLASFQGIPYAKPPVGDLRFMPPEPADPWTEPLDADLSPWPICWQIFGLGGQEDCLYLVIHTPADLDSEELLPVMFYIHGGGFDYGSAEREFAPDFLCDYGVVAVSVNYRLRGLGFFASEATGLTGNQGFRDQKLALEWVRDNIAFFGGDPDKVTIFGESAGSWSVMHQVLSMQAQGLFRGAIGQSGTPVGHLSYIYFTGEQALAEGKKLEEALFCDEPPEGQTVLECLQAAPAQLIAAADYRSRGVIDGHLGAEDPYLEEVPEDLLASGRFTQVPVLMGSNSGETSGLYPNILLDPEGEMAEIETLWDDYYGPFYTYERTEVSAEEAEVIADAKSFYFPDGVIEGPEDLHQLVKYSTDTQYQYGVHSMALALSEHVPTYQYLLSFAGSLGFVARNDLPTWGFDFGASHTDDLTFLFKYDYSYQGDDWTDDDRLVQARLLRFWTNFAKTLNPTPQDDQSEELGDFVWTLVGEDPDGQYVEISPAERLEMRTSEDYRSRMEFWENAVGLN